jgi:hypothetical protein
VVRALISTNPAVPTVTFIGTLDVFLKAPRVWHRAEPSIDILK